MSTVTEILNNGQQAIYNFDTTKIFVRENRYQSGSITNGGLVDLVIPAGTLLGRVGASQLMKVLASGSTDGSQFPVGISAQDLTIAPAATAAITFCIGGDVVESKIILDGSDTLATLIDDRSIRDRVAGDTLGIKLVPSDQLTAFDNS
jgi:hypothetical protein